MIGRLCPYPPARRVWRPAANLFYVSGFAGVPAAASCSGSAAIATEDSVTAARHVATQPIVNSGDALTGAISKVSKGGSIIETVSASIDEATHPCAVGRDRMKLPSGSTLCLRMPLGGR